jgi:hypothetical protein
MIPDTRGCCQRAFLWPPQSGAAEEAAAASDAAAAGDRATMRTTEATTVAVAEHVDLGARVLFKCGDNISKVKIKINIILSQRRLSTLTSAAKRLYLR